MKRLLDPQAPSPPRAGARCLLQAEVTVDSPPEVDPPPPPPITPINRSPKARRASAPQATTRGPR